MGVDAAIDITTDDHQTVLALLRRHLPGTTAWAYGSRVKWTSRPQSDLDLVVFARPEQRSHVGTLREAFEESNLPFRVDLFVWDDVPESFRERIHAEHVVLATKNKPIGEGHPALPENWDTMPFTDAFLTNPAVHIERGGATPFVDMAALNPGLRAVHSAEIRTFRGSGSRFQNGDTLMARITPCLENGKIARYYADSDGEVGHGSTEFIVVRGRPDVTDTEYAFYVSRSDLVRGYAIDQMTGTSGRQRVPADSLAHLDVAVPPLSEQRAIAHVLGTLDDKIELNRRMNATLEAMARALFRSWFVDFEPVRAKMQGRDTGLPKDIANLFPDRLVDSALGEIPEGWMTGTLGDIVSLNPESWRTDAAPQSVTYVDLANTKWGYIEKVEVYPWQHAPSRARRVLRKGDTIVATVRPGNGSFALIDEDGLTGSTGFATLRPRRIHDRELTWCAATSSDNIDRLAHLADGGAYPAVRPDAVLATPIVLANCGARKAFASATAVLLDRIEINKRACRALASLRDVLLPRLVSGELRVPVANLPYGDRSDG